jgi:RHS repeat-associated protein
MVGFVGALLLSIGLGSAIAPPPALPTISAPAPPSSLADSVAAPAFAPSAADPHLAVPYFGARYYGSRIGRFTTTDPVYTWSENLVDPQRWNRYAYARNNPLRYVDPDGREIALASNLSKGDAKFLVNALTEIAARPTGRDALTTLINDPNTIVFGVGNVNDPAKVEAARKGETVGLTFGTTTFLDPTTNEVNVTIDRQALREFASRTKPSIDSRGVTSTGHEIYHARDALSGKPQQFVAGDRPTSATGPAERFGQSVRREKKDIAKTEARGIVTRALEKKQE